MNQEQQISAEQSGPSTTAGAWGMRNTGLIMGDPSKNYVKEFTGIWALKPNADLVAFTKALAPGGWLNPPGVFLEHDHKARADPNGALVRHQDTILRRLYPRLHFSVRWNR